MATEATSNLTDWAAIVISLLAFGISIASFGHTRMAAKVNLLREMHSLLLQEDTQNGRRLLHEAWEESDGDPNWDLWKNERRDDWAKMNRALALFNAFAYQYHRGWFPMERRWVPKTRWTRRWAGRDAVMDLWRTNLITTADVARSFTDYRDKSDKLPEGVTRWPDLSDLLHAIADDQADA